MADPKSSKTPDPKNRAPVPLRNSQPAFKPAPKPGAGPASKPASKPGTTKSKPSRAASQPQPQPPAPRPVPRRKTSPSSVRLVERRRPDTSKPGLLGRLRKVLSDPERLGQLAFDRPGWLDELAAIVLIVFGMVSLLSLLNTTRAAALSDMWSDTIRQIFGQVGAALLSIMILSAGILIMLPKIGIVVRTLWQRILAIEVAYVALLALLHLFANDPEPRALARSGQGGGYIGWAVGDTLAKLFGSGLAILAFSALMVFCLGYALGIRRSQVRKATLATVKRIEMIAARLRRATERPILLSRPGGLRGRQHVVPAPDAERPAPTETPAARRSGIFGRRHEPIPAAAALKPSTSSTPLSHSQMARPFSGVEKPVETPSVASVTPISKPSEATSAPTATPLPAAATLGLAQAVAVSEFARPFTAPQGSPAAGKAGQSGTADPEPALPKPVAPPRPFAQERPPARSQPAVPPKPSRHFTVEDFKEVRLPLKRDGLPPIGVLDDVELNRPTEDEINNNVRIIENTLLEFDIDVEVVDVKVGPTVTQYAVQPFREVTNEQGEVVMQRVRVNKIASLGGDLALALAAKRLRVQPYVPGHPYMGIEVPNHTPSIVALRPVMESEIFAKAFIRPDPENSGQTREMPLIVPLGRDVSGAAVAVDLAAMPHLLIAGTTGSGKSVCIAALAVALVMNNTPDRLKMVLLDPKMVELQRFNGLPHLLGPVETDSERIIGVLRWATREMDRRYKLLEAEGARNLETYNRSLGSARKADHLPYIAILVDEIGDLMLSRPEEMERTLTRLAQMARAVGMHLVVATQRPSVDIITGLIKANFPARISFAVASGVDSRVILDTTGAESLMGRGDMLYLAPDASGPQRVQGCFVSDPEIDRVVNYWKDWRRQNATTTPSQEPPWEKAMTRREALAEADPMLEEAIDLVVREGEASASLIQRKLGIDYPRAAHLMDLLAELGVIGRFKEGGRSREVLLKPGSDPYKKLMSKYKK